MFYTGRVVRSRKAMRHSCSFKKAWEHKCRDEELRRSVIGWLDTLPCSSLIEYNVVRTVRLSPVLSIPSGAFIFTSLALNDSDELPTLFAVLTGSSKARGGPRLLSSPVRSVVVVGMIMGCPPSRRDITTVRIPPDLEL